MGATDARRLCCGACTLSTVPQTVGRYLDLPTICLEPVTQTSPASMRTSAQYISSWHHVPMAITMSLPSTMSLTSGFGFLFCSRSQPVGVQAGQMAHTRPMRLGRAQVLGKSEVSRLVASGTIELMPLAFLRGRTLRDCWVIADEMQVQTSTLFLWEGGCFFCFLHPSVACSSFAGSWALVSLVAGLLPRRHRATGSAHTQCLMHCYIRTVMP